MTNPPPSGIPTALDAERAIAAAPLPTPQTLRARQSVLFQALRFVILNVRIMRMVFKGNH